MKVLNIEGIFQVYVPNLIFLLIFVKISTLKFSGTGDTIMIFLIF